MTSGRPVSYTYEKSAAGKQPTIHQQLTSFFLACHVGNLRPYGVCVSVVKGSMEVSLPKKKIDGDTPPAKQQNEMDRDACRRIRGRTKAKEERMKKIDIKPPLLKHGDVWNAVRAPRLSTDRSKLVKIKFYYLLTNTSKLGESCVGL